MTKPKDQATVASADDIVLLPCPFCGDDASSDIWFSESDDCYEINCRKCGAIMQGTTRQRVVTGWNNRRAAGLVNWLDSEYEKSGAVSYLTPRCQALKECRKMVKRLLGQ